MYSVCNCFTHSFVSFFVLTGMKIMWHMNFVYARFKIIGYIGFVSVHIVCIPLCLWVQVCTAILAVYCIPSFCIKLPVICFVVYCLTHNPANAKQFFIWHPKQCWAITWHTKNLHLTQFSLCLVLTEHLPSCFIFNWIYVLKTYWPINFGT